MFNCVHIPILEISISYLNFYESLHLGKRSKPITFPSTTPGSCERWLNSPRIPTDRGLNLIDDLLGCLLMLLVPATTWRKHVSSLAILVSFAFLYSIVAGRIEKSPFSGPLAFIALVAVLLMGYVEGLLS